MRADPGSSSYGAVGDDCGQAAWRDPPAHIDGDMCEGDRGEMRRVSRDGRAVFSRRPGVPHLPG